VTKVAAWLGDHLPTSGSGSVVHGDYRLGNVMYEPARPARLVAVLDWEMATIGDPLADVGYLSATWADRDDPPNPQTELTPVTRLEGFLSRGELLARYEARSGRSAEQIAFYEALALWKSAVFMEGNYRRALTGATDDPHLLGFRDGVIELAERALARTRA
jgi:aminoglycoside phosphotransferase (APT) family kinase protein